MADADLAVEERLSQSSGKYKKLCATNHDAIASGCASGPSTSSDGGHIGGQASAAEL